MNRSRPNDACPGCREYVYVAQGAGPARGGVHRQEQCREEQPDQHGVQPKGESASRPLRGPIEPEDALSSVDGENQAKSVKLFLQLLSADGPVDPAVCRLVGRLVGRSSVY